MTLGGDITAALPGLRAQAESMMTATCLITRPGVQVWNPATMQYESIPVDVYVGRCRLRPTQQIDRGQNAADQAFVESSYTLSLPVAGSEGVQKDDTVEITAYPADAALVGRKYTVVVDVAHSDGTARRLPVREVQ